MRSSKIHNFSGSFSSIESAYLGNEFNANTINIGQLNYLEKRRADIAKALVYPDIESRKSSILPPVWTSFDWIWQTNFAQWLTKSKDIFWITGKAGSGKSTLVKYLVEHYRVRELLAADSHDWCVVHFFFDYNFGQDTANNAEGLLRSLLVQLVRENAVVADALQQAVTGNTISATEEQLFDALTFILHHRTERFCLFIDGLDEYRGQISRLLNMLLRLQQQANVAMCIASRDIAVVRAKIGRYQSIVMEDHNLQSIRKFLTTMNDDLVTELRSPCPEIVLLAIAAKADGVILWARFAFERLLEKLENNDSSETELLAAIDDLPTEMENMYAQALERIPAKFKSEAAFYLSYTSAAQVNLTTAELYELVKILASNYPTEFHVPTRLSSEQFSQRLYALLGGLITIRSRNAIEYIADSMAANRCIQASRRGSPGFIDVHVIHPIHETLHFYLESSGWIHQRLYWLTPEEDARLSRMQLYVLAMEDMSRNHQTMFGTSSHIVARWFEDKAPNKLTEEERNILSEDCFPIIASIRVLNELDHHENVVSQAGPDALKRRLHTIGRALPGNRYNMSAKFPLLPVLLRGLMTPLMLFGLPFLHVDVERHLRQYLSCGFMAWSLLLPSPETLIIALHNNVFLTEELKQAMIASAIRELTSQRYRSTAHDHAGAALMLVAQLLNALPDDGHWMTLYNSKNSVERSLSNLRDVLDMYGWRRLHSPIDFSHHCGLQDCPGFSFLYHIAIDSWVGTKSFPLLPERSFALISRKVQRVKLVMSLYGSIPGLQKRCYPDGSFLHAVFCVQPYGYRWAGELLLKVLFAIRNGVNIRACSGFVPLHDTMWRLACKTRKLLEATESSPLFQPGDRRAYYLEVEALLKLFDYNDNAFYLDLFEDAKLPATVLDDCEALGLELLRQCRPRDWALLLRMNVDIPDLPPSVLGPLLKQLDLDASTSYRASTIAMHDYGSPEEQARALAGAASLDHGFGGFTTPAKMLGTMTLDVDSKFQGFTFTDELALNMGFGEPSEIPGGGGVHWFPDYRGMLAGEILPDMSDLRFKYE